MMPCAVLSFGLDKNNVLSDHVFPIMSFISQPTCPSTKTTNNKPLDHKLQGRPLGRSHALMCTHRDVLSSTNSWALELPNKQDGRFVRRGSSNLTKPSACSSDGRKYFLHCLLVSIVFTYASRSMCILPNVLPHSNINMLPFILFYFTFTSLATTSAYPSRRACLHHIEWSSTAFVRWQSGAFPWASGGNPSTTGSS